MSHLESATHVDHWRGFPTLAGESETWVTGFVVAHLAAISPCSTFVTKARRFLAGQRLPNGGWGYGGNVPPDSDSTAWCLAALAGTRALSRQDRAEAQAFLLEHLQGGGIRTYLPDSGIREYIGARAHVRIDGWTSPHPDVTAATLLSGASRRGGLQARQMLALLASQQDRAGVIRAYWWRPPFYTAALTLRACVRHRLRLPERTLDGIAWLVDRKQLDHGGYGLGAKLELDPFSTALALECLVYLGRRCSKSRRRAAADGLVREQLVDGSWRGDYVLRIPAPSVVDPKDVSTWDLGTGGGNSFVPDSQGLFATSLACHALALHARVEAGEALQISDDWPKLDLIDQAETDVAVVANTSPQVNERCVSPPVH